MFDRALLNRKELGMVACNFHLSYSGKPKIGGSQSRPLASVKSETLLPK
jgi:hypothetical protein